MEGSVYYYHCLLPFFRPLTTPLNILLILLGLLLLVVVAFVSKKRKPKHSATYLYMKSWALFLVEYVSQPAYLPPALPGAKQSSAPLKHSAKAAELAARHEAKGPLIIVVVFVLDMCSFAFTSGRVWSMHGFFLHQPCVVVRVTEADACAHVWGNTAHMCRNTPLSCIDTCCSLPTVHAHPSSRRPSDTRAHLLLQSQRFQGVYRGGRTKPTMGAAAAPPAATTTTAWVPDLRPPCPRLPPLPPRPTPPPPPPPPPLTRGRSAGSGSGDRPRRKGTHTVVVAIVTRPSRFLRWTWCWRSTTQDPAASVSPSRYVGYSYPLGRRA